MIQMLEYFWKPRCRLDQRSDASFDAAFRATIHTALEVIMNLSYLTKLEAEYPEKVRAHMGVIEQRIGELRRFMGAPVDGPLTE